MLGLDKAYFEHIPADLGNVLVRCYCTLTGIPTIEAKETLIPSGPSSPASDNGPGRLDFGDGDTEGAEDNVDVFAEGGSRTRSSPRTPS